MHAHLSIPPSLPWPSHHSRTHLSPGKEAGLKGFELPKGCHLDAHPFSIEQDLVTPKLSLKRPQLARHYRAQVCACMCVAAAHTHHGVWCACVGACRGVGGVRCNHCAQAC
jgi:hypothetical protein